MEQMEVTSVIFSLSSLYLNKLIKYRTEKNSVWQSVMSSSQGEKEKKEEDWNARDCSCSLR